MGEQLQYNQISQGLRDLLPKLKGDETITFRVPQVSNVNKINDDFTVQNQTVAAASYNVPNIDRIFDPFLNNNEGGYVDIAYVTGQAPATPNSPARTVLGRFEFQGTNMLTRTLSRKDQDLILYLCLCNYNKDSVNPGKQMPDAGYLFEQVKPAEDAKTIRARNLLILQAKAMVEEAESEELTIMRELFGIPEIEGNAKLTKEEIKNRLDRIAEANPQAVINSTSEVGGKLRVLIRESVKAKRIEYSEEAGQWQWSDTKIAIASKAPSVGEEDSLLAYLQSNGSIANETLKKLQKLNKK